MKVAEMLNRMPVESTDDKCKVQKNNKIGCKI
jgi:hypothetical protein